MSKNPSSPQKRYWRSASPADSLWRRRGCLFYACFVRKFSKNFRPQNQCLWYPENSNNFPTIKRNAASFKSFNRSGQTLPETVVAISLITIGLLSSAGFFSMSMKNANMIANQAVAVNLATEGIELTKNYFDGLSAAGTSWDTVLPVTYETAYNTNPLLSARSSRRPMTVDSSTGFYGYFTSPAGKTSPFSREIKISKTVTGVKVSSTVFWKESGNDKNVGFTVELLKWQ